MKKIISLALSLVLAASLFGCFGESYKVDYHGQKDFFAGAKDSYRAGEKVKLVYGEIATDTDYSFHVIGAEFSTDFENEAYVIRFTMPENDVEVYVESRNSMVNDIE